MLSSDAKAALRKLLPDGFVAVAFPHHAKPGAITSLTTLMRGGLTARGYKAVMNALSIGASGMMAAASRFDASAVRTAGGQADLPTEAVNQINAKTDFTASAKVVQTADQMMGALLDMKV